MRLRYFIPVALLACAPAVASAEVLLANATANNGGSSGWAIFFDLTSSGAPLSVTDLTTASTAAAGAGFTVEVFTRPGSALGGPVTTGPGSSPAGWTSLGTAAGTQGATAGGISQPIDIPDIAVGGGQTTGVALLFTGAGPRYFGSGTGPYQIFSDLNLTLTTGDARSVPFTTTGSFFSPRGLAGSLTYVVVPEPGSMAALASAAALLLVRRRRSL